MTGEELPAHEVRKARLTDLGYIGDKKVWRHVPWSLPATPQNCDRGDQGAPKLGEAEVVGEVTVERCNPVGRDGELVLARSESASIGPMGLGLRGVLPQPLRAK